MSKDKKDVTLATGVTSSETSSSNGEKPFMLNHNDGTASIYYDLASGSVVRRDDFTTVTWDNDDAQHGGDSFPSDAKEKIRKAVKYYSQDPLVNKSVKLLAQLANDSFRIQSEDKPTEDFFMQWWKDIGGDEFLSWFFLEFFRSGNVPIFKTLIPYVPQNYDPEKAPVTDAVASKSKQVSSDSVKAQKQYDEAYENLQSTIEAHKKGKTTKHYVAKAEKVLAAVKKTWSIKSIPGAYTILNPLTIDIEGPAELPWLRTPHLKINDEIKKVIQTPSKELKGIIKHIPKEIISAIKKGEDKVPLPEYLCTIVTRDKQPYETWAEPLCSHAFDALDFKRDLRSMDRHTVRGVRNRILKVTIGNDNFPVFDDTALKALAQEFNNPSRNLTIFWNHTLNIEYIEPNLDSLSMEKYEPVLEEIRTTFGVAKILTGNDGDTVGNNVLNLKGLVEVLTEAQIVFLTWFRQEAKRVAEATSMPKLPEGTFGKLNLKDEQEFTRVLATLVDRQVISYETMVETLGYHFPKEVDRLKKEKELRDSEGILVPQQAPTQQQVSPTGNEGRPSGTPEDDGREKRKNKTRTPKGGTTASSDQYHFAGMLAEVRTSFDNVYGQKIKELKDDGKRITPKRQEEIVMTSLAQVAKDVAGDEGVKLLNSSLQVAEGIIERFPDTKKEDIILSCMVSQSECHTEEN